MLPQHDEQPFEQYTESTPVGVGSSLLHRPDFAPPVHFVLDDYGPFGRRRILCESERSPRPLLTQRVRVSFVQMSCALSPSNILEVVSVDEMPILLLL